MQTARKFQSEFNCLPSDRSRRTDGLSKFVDQRELDDLIYWAARVCVCNWHQEEPEEVERVSIFEFDDGSILRIYNPTQRAFPAAALVDEA